MEVSRHIVPGIDIEPTHQPQCCNTMVPVDDDAARERQQREGDARRERNVRP